MKKNNMMRLASALLVLVLLTTCAISGTFAKYITENDAADTARVAKFGVVLQADGVLYDTEYYDVNQTDANIPASEETVAKVSVNSEDTWKVVAPGTKSEDGLHFAINGNPEVRTDLDAEIVIQNIYLKKGTYGVMVEAPTVTINSWKADTYYTKDAQGAYTMSGEFDPNVTMYYTLEKGVTLDTDYYPVIYTAENDADGTYKTDSLKEVAETYMTALNSATVTAVGAGYEKTLTIESKIYDVNFNYADLTVAAETLEWAWAFERDDCAWEDGADTILGDLMETDDKIAKDGLTDTVYAAADTYELTNGEVVKLQGDGATYKAPVAATETAENDYHLTTSFSMDITVTQVD